jgi:hypothetical protein
MNMKDRIFTASEIVKALWQVRTFIDDNELYGWINSNEAGNRRVGVSEVADALGVEAAYSDYEPQPDAGNKV